MINNMDKSNMNKIVLNICILPKICMPKSIVEVFENIYELKCIDKEYNYLFCYYSLSQLIMIIEFVRDLNNIFYPLLSPN